MKGIFFLLPHHLCRPQRHCRHAIRPIIPTTSLIQNTCIVALPPGAQCMKRLRLYWKCRPKSRVRDYCTKVAMHEAELNVGNRPPLDGLLGDSGYI